MLLLQMFVFNYSRYLLETTDEIPNGLISHTSLFVVKVYQHLNEHMDVFSLVNLWGLFG
jgi:hypothetical protein